MKASPPWRYFVCHVDGDQGEHPIYGEMYVWDGKYARSPEDIGDRDRNPILILRPQMGTERFNCDSGWLTEVDRWTREPLDDHADAGTFDPTEPIPGPIDYGSCPF